MYVVISLFSIWIFVRTLSYGLYELKEQKNKLGGFIVILLAIISLIVPTMAVFFKGNY